MAEDAVVQAFRELKGQKWHTRDGIHVKNENALIQGVTTEEPDKTGLFALFVTVMIPHHGFASFLEGRKFRVISSDGEKREATFNKHGGVIVPHLSPGLYNAELVEE